MTPGPGQYQYKEYVGKDGPKITMSSRPQTSLVKSSDPGPGHYNSNLVSRPTTPSYKIGTAKRDGGFKFMYDMPGPGQYSPTDNISKRPKSPYWSMGTGKRGGLYTSESGPGPGNYNVAKGVGGGPKVKIQIKCSILLKEKISMFQKQVLYLVLVNMTLIPEQQ
jgi:hypothetical protein